MLHGMAKKIKILIKVIINKTKKEKKLQIPLTQLYLRDIYRILTQQQQTTHLYKGTWNILQERPDVRPQNKSQYILKN